MSILSKLVKFISADERTADSSKFYESLRSVLENDENALIYAEILLLLEVAFADDHLSSSELSAIKAMLTDDYQVSIEERDKLIERSKLLYRQLTSSFEITRYINKQATYEQKLALFQKIWRVAYADNKLDPLEEARSRQLADLLYIRHVDYIRLRNQERTA